MRGLTFLGNSKIEMADLPDPEMKRGQMLVRIRNGLPISRLITAAYPLEQFEETYSRFMAGLEGKVILLH